MASTTAFCSRTYLAQRSKRTCSGMYSDVFALYFCDGRNNTQIAVNKSPILSEIEAIKRRSWRIKLYEGKARNSDQCGVSTRSRVNRPNHFKSLNVKSLYLFGACLLFCACASHEFHPTSVNSRSGRLLRAHSSILNTQFRSTTLSCAAVYGDWLFGGNQPRSIFECGQGRRQLSQTTGSGRRIGRIAWQELRTNRSPDKCDYYAEWRKCDCNGNNDHRPPAHRQSNSSF